MNRRLLAAAVVLVLALLVVPLTLFGDNLRALFGMSADAISGEPLITARLERKRLMPSAPLPPHQTTDTRFDRQSTFAIDVDTASWSWARRLISDFGVRPPHDGVRVEEWVNAFSYSLPPPQDTPVAITVDGAVSPFDERKTLLRVALKAREVRVRQPVNLVFLVDTSGSMRGEDRLPLAQAALHTLVANLRDDDVVSLVTYAGSTEVRLAPTRAAQRREIDDAIDALSAGGGTAMGSGMRLAYDLAVGQVRQGTSTRVVVLTDGDTNIGPDLTPEAMLDAVHAHVEEGVTLTTVGFGVGNYRGGALEQLADRGNGQALYVGDRRDVEKAFCRELTSTLQVVGKDVKVQVTFDPEVVRSYRLIGYENRDLADADFRNDRVDAGELGAGHAVTALYEVELTSTPGALGTIAVRGKDVDSGAAWEVSRQALRAEVSHPLDAAPTDLRFAAAVALAADHLRGNPAAGWSLHAIAALARGARGDHAERDEFVRVLERAETLPPSPRTPQAALGEY